MTLHDLARFASVDDALATIDRREPELFETRIASIAEAIVAMWHGDAGYETGDPEAEGGRHRLVMADDGWTYERSDGAGE